MSDEDLHALLQPPFIPGFAFRSIDIGPHYGAATSFSATVGLGSWEIAFNHWLHAGATASTLFALDSATEVEMNIHDNWFISTVTTVSFLDFNPSASMQKIVRNNIFDLSSTRRSPMQSTGKLERKQDHA
jgi:hypothetical protein